MQTDAFRPPRTYHTSIVLSTREQIESDMMHKWKDSNVCLLTNVMYTRLKDYF